VEKIAGRHKLKALVLDSASSPITKHAYDMALDEFLARFQQPPRSSIIIRMPAVRKLAAEAADNGLLTPEPAAAIARVKERQNLGIRMGNGLSARQAQSLLNAPYISMAWGLRDRAILAVLMGCSMSEVAALTFGRVQQRGGRWCIRAAPMPVIDAGTVVAAIANSAL
jgi:site-specific recombinase XerD